MASALSDEITMTLLEDLRQAIESVMKNTLPSVPVDVRLVMQPKMGVLVTVREADDPRYPTIHVAKVAYLRPTNYFRRLNGLDVEEE